RQAPARPGGAGLPDLHALTRFEPQTVPGPGGKHLVELVDILDHLVATELLGGVRVDRQEPDRFLVSGLHPPDARVRLEDEPERILLRQIGVHPAGAGEPVGLNRNPEPAHVADSLTEGEWTDDVEQTSQRRARA